MANAVPDHLYTDVHRADALPVAASVHRRRFSPGQIAATLAIIVMLTILVAAAPAAWFPEALGGGPAQGSRSEGAKHGHGYVRP